MPSCKHLLFIIADHFEPDSPHQIRDWLRQYSMTISEHKDSYGRHPQVTWFYWGKNYEELTELKKAQEQKLGEVELHIHHDNDTSEGLKNRINDHLMAFVAAGVRDKKESSFFGFTHGYWSLDNSGGNNRCGVNDELLVLKESGCFADFTFPANGPMQPRKQNSIYYATDDPYRPKSYDSGVDVQVGRLPSGDLMIFQGPGQRSGFSKLCKIGFLKLFIDHFITYTDLNVAPTLKRLQRWVTANIHVKGRPEWIFIKCHQHGAREKDYPVLFGSAMKKIFSALETRYNDGKSWKLHYITAREAYNIVKAAEKGRAGDPHHFRDYVIQPYS